MRVREKGSAAAKDITMASGLSHQLGKYLTRVILALRMSDVYHYAVGTASRLNNIIFNPMILFILNLIEQRLSG